MKSKINKFSLNFIIISILFIITSSSTIAMVEDTEQPIYIKSNAQSIDMQGNIIIFTGNVVITQGTIRINADKVVVTRSHSNKNNIKEIIDSYGHPAFFYHMQDNGKPMKGSALHMHYEPVKNLVILSGNAHLEQLDSNITGDRFTYCVKEKKIQAYSEKGKCVTTVLMPFHIHNK